MRARWLVVAIVVIGCAPVLGLDEPSAVELGAICTGSNGGDVGRCLPSLDVCLTLDGTVDWCTTSCGTGAPASGSGSLVPPPGGDRLCRLFSSSGTPVCGLADPSSSQTITWYCEILCGVLEGQSLGSCPPGLVCRMNICM